MFYFVMFLCSLLFYFFHLVLVNVCECDDCMVICGLLPVYVEVLNNRLTVLKYGCICDTI